MRSLRVLLFRLLRLDNYLAIIRFGFFAMYRSGRLRSNPEYRWHYFVPQLVRPGDVVVDIGANLGYFSSIFCKAAGADGKVYSVEPIRPYVKQLKKTLKHETNSVVLDFALGDKNADRIVLGVPDRFRKIGYLRHGLPTVLSGDAVADNKYAFASSLRKASEVFADLERIDYVKCDIEGYEPVVFEDMKAVFAKHKPLVQVETWGDNFFRTLGIMASIGFQPYKIAGESRLELMRREPEWELPQGDILFVHHDATHRIASLLEPV